MSFKLALPLLLSVAAAVALAARRFRVPYTVALELRAGAQRSVERRLLVIEKDALQRAMNAGAIDREAAEALLRDADARLLTLDGEGDAAG